METKKPSMRGKNKKGKYYHQTFDRSRKKVKDSFANGWLSGLKAKYLRGTISKEQYEDSVEAWKTFGRSTYNGATTFTINPSRSKGRSDYDYQG